MSILWLEKLRKHNIRIGEAIYRHLLWLFIGVSFTANKVGSLKNSEIKKVSEELIHKLLEWNTLGAIAIVLAFIALISNTLEKKNDYRIGKYMPTITKMSQKLSSDLLLPVFCMGSTVIGGILYVLLKTAPSFQEVFLTLMFYIFFLFVLTIIWALLDAPKTSFYEETSNQIATLNYKKVIFLFFLTIAGFIIILL